MSKTSMIFPSYVLISTLLLLVDAKAGVKDLGRGEFLTMFNELVERVSNTKFEPVQNINQDMMRCKRPTNGTLQSASFPWHFPGEGDGLVFIRRFGPVESYGGDDTICIYPDYIGPGGSYLKGFWERIVDAETGGSVGYPPIHIHHWPVQYSTHIYYGRRSTANDRVCRAIETPDGREWPIYDKRVDCTFHYFKRGIGYYVPEDISVRDGDDIQASAMLNDIREVGAPPFQFYIDSYSFWLTKPSIEMTKAIAFGIDTSAARHGPTKTTVYNLPTNDHGLQMTTIQMPADGYFSDLNVHMHAHEGDEIWLLKGHLAKIMEIPKEGEYAMFHQVRKYDCKKKPGSSPLNAFPLSQVPVLQHWFQTVGNRIAPNNMGEFYNRTQNSAQFTAAKDLIARRLGPDLYCRLRGHTETFDRRRLDLVASPSYDTAAYYATEGKDVGMEDYGDAVSLSGRTGWKEGSYYRHVTAHGPGCDVARFKKGDIITLVGLNINRGIDFMQHSNLAGTIAFDHVTVEEGCAD